MKEVQTTNRMGPRSTGATAFRGPEIAKKQLRAAEAAGHLRIYPDKHPDVEVDGERQDGDDVAFVSVGMTLQCNK
jgi:hypothetical protein